MVNKSSTGYKISMVFVTIVTVNVVYFTTLNGRGETPQTRVTMASSLQYVKNQKDSGDSMFDVIDSSFLVEYSFEAIQQEAAAIQARARGLVQLDSGPCEQRLPQCLIIGNFKCGTRELLDFMSMHPRIMVKTQPDYETKFFTNHYFRGLEWYRQLMPCTYANQVTTEKSPDYFQSETSPALIHAMNSSIRLIVLVREPVARTVSQFTFHYNDFRTSNHTLEEAVINIFGEINSGKNFVKNSIYDIGMERYLRFFDISQIKVIDSEDFKRDPYAVLYDLETFLNLEHTIHRHNFIFNEEKGFFCLRQDKNSKTASCYHDKRGRNTTGVAETITESQEVLKKLQEFFKSHNERFFRLIGRSFDW